MKAVLAILGAMLWATIGAQAQLANVYVATGGLDGNTGEDWETAKLTIQAGVDAAAAGGTVWVSNGVYTLASQITLTGGKTVKGFHGTNDPAKETVVNGAAAYRCFSVTGGILDGLVISNGAAAYAAGVYMNGGTVMHCRVEGNVAVPIGGNASRLMGGGMMLTNTCLVTNCVFLRNAHRYNTGMGGDQYGGSALALFDPDCLVTDCEIAENLNSNAQGSIIGTVVIQQGGILRGCHLHHNTNLYAARYVIRTYQTPVAAEPLVQDCTIANNDFPTINTNEAGFTLNLGAGLAASGCLIADNENALGVSMEAAGARLSDSTIRGHTNCGANGAGVNMIAAGTVERCLIESNTVTTGNSNARGGGIYCVGGSILDSTIRGNRILNTRGGGGIFVKDTAGIISNCWIEGNYGNPTGGGVQNEIPGTLLLDSVLIGNTAPYHGGGAYGVSTIRNCLIVSNRTVTFDGGGLHGSSRIESSTVAYNRAGRNGGGLYTASASALVLNTILYGNTAGTSGSNWYNNVTGVTYTNCCTMPTDTLPGEGNLNADPLFEDPANGRYQLQSGSLCINAGLYDTWMEGARDLDGHARLDRFSRQPDIGAYEHVPAGTLMQIK